LGLPLSALSIAIDNDGPSALAYWSDRGTRSGVVILDSSGNQLRVIETEPYKPSQVCFAPDHSIWVLGDILQLRDTPASDFMTFRHYSRDGKLIGSFVPRSELPAWQGFGSDQVVAPFVGLWRMRAISDRLGVALGLGSNREAWVELDFDGKLIGQWTYAVSQQESEFPAAFDSKGVLYGKHFIDRHLVGMSIFDKNTSSWKPVDSLPSGQLIAADGLRLVYQHGDKLKWVLGLSREPTP
jgi:hypothetical protein